MHPNFSYNFKTKFKRTSSAGRYHFLMINPLQFSTLFVGSKTTIKANVMQMYEVDKLRGRNLSEASQFMNKKYRLSINANYRKTYPSGAWLKPFFLNTTIHLGWLFCFNLNRSNLKWLKCKRHTTRMCHQPS